MIYFVLILDKENQTEPDIKTEEYVPAIIPITIGKAKFLTA